MAIIPLCVPFVRKSEARAAGAVWQVEERFWACGPALLRTDAYTRLKQFVPRMYRPDLDGPVLRPWLVPSPLWGKNLRAILSKDDWDRVRRHAYEEAGRRCRVCGGCGPQWPVEADEGFAYDDDALTHTLMGVIGLCPTCHEVRHWGKTIMKGREEAAFDHLRRVNGWSEEAAISAIDEAFEMWEWRSSRSWKSDYSWVTRTHGIEVPSNAEDLAEAANRSIIGMPSDDRSQLVVSHRRDQIAPHSGEPSVFWSIRGLRRLVLSMLRR